jgi:hypothetical protein
VAVDQYASVRKFFPETLPAGLTGDDQARVASYDVYENMYWNNPDTYKIVARSEDQSPLYLPSAMNMIEAAQRFLATEWDFFVDPKVGLEADQKIVSEMFKQLFKREDMYAKFATQKRFGLIRGDAMWHITADPGKDAGKRISIHELHPGHYFPIEDANDADRIIGCYIVDSVKDPRDDTKFVSRRQKYIKDNDEGAIISTLELYELDKWDDRADPDAPVKVQDVRGQIVLDPRITQIPVYHVKNFRTSARYGSSQIRGLETVFAAINQAVSDQDLALSMQGLGVYWTDGGPPKDSEGNDMPFTMGPAEVVEVGPGSTFGRVTGVGAGLPGIEHMAYLLDQASEANGIPQVARGRADVQVAESGISLAIQMAPLLSQNGEKEQVMLGVLDQMFYDLVNMWFPVYEQMPAEAAVEVTNVVGDPMPQNREAQIAEILTLITSVPPLITIEMAQDKLAQLGYEFPPNASQAVIDEAASITGARTATDPFAERMTQEGGNNAADPNAPTPAPPAGGGAPPFGK